MQLTFVCQKSWIGITIAINIIMKLIYMGCRFTYVGYSCAIAKPNSMHLTPGRAFRALDVIYEDWEDDEEEAKIAEPMTTGSSQMSQVVAK